MSLEQFIRDLEVTIEDVEPGSLGPETRYRELAQWDSLAVLSVIAMVDAEYDCRLKAKTLKDCETIEALYRVVREGGGR